VADVADQSGITFHEAQVALAKVYVGSEDIEGDVDEVVNIEQPHDRLTGADQIGKKDTVEKAVPLPATVDEVKIHQLRGFNGHTDSGSRRRTLSSALKMPGNIVTNSCTFYERTRAAQQR
jgi:hypothetical protein